MQQNKEVTVMNERNVLNAYLSEIYNAILSRPYTDTKM